MRRQAARGRRPPTADHPCAPQIIVPNASFLGHLCGILAGTLYVYGYLNGLLALPAFVASMLERWEHHPHAVHEPVAPSGGYQPAASASTTAAGSPREAMYDAVMRRAQQSAARGQPRPASEQR